MSWESVIQALAANSAGVLRVKAKKLDHERLRQVVRTANEVGVHRWATLTQVLEHLPQLYHLRIIPDTSTIRSSNSLRRIPRFYRTIFCGYEDWDTPVNYPSIPQAPVGAVQQCITQAVEAAHSAKAKVSELSLSLISWHSLFQYSPLGRAMPLSITAGWSSMLPRLRTLQISFKDGVMRNAASDLKPLRQLLKLCISLDKLHIGFLAGTTKNRLVSDSKPSSCLRHLCSTGSASQSLNPNLRALYLQNIATTQSDLERYLADHAATLRHIRLEGVHLVRPYSEDPRGCWVAVFDYLRGTLRLMTIRFNGWLTNGGRQRWYISQNAASSHRIRPSVIAYIERRSNINPLDDVRIKSGENDVNSTHIEGDWTWAMVYTEKRTTAACPFLSGYHFFSKNPQQDSSVPEPVMGVCAGQVRPRSASTSHTMAQVPPLGLQAMGLLSPSAPPKKLNYWPVPDPKIGSEAPKVWPGPQQMPPSTTFEYISTAGPPLTTATTSWSIEQVAEPFATSIQQSSHPATAQSSAAGAGTGGDFDFLSPALWDAVDEPWPVATPNPAGQTPEQAWMAIPDLYGSSDSDMS